MKVSSPVLELIEISEASSPVKEYVRVSPSASVAVTVPIAVTFSATAIAPTFANVGALFAGGVGGVGVELPPPPPPHDVMMKVKTKNRENL